EFRVVQLLSDVGELFRQKPTGVGTRMKMMVADGEIPLDSELYQRGITQFELNMREVLRILHQHNVPTFFSNLVSNQKDLRPFISFQPKGTQFPSFRKNYESGAKAFEKKEF